MYGPSHSLIRILPLIQWVIARINGRDKTKQDLLVRLGEAMLRLGGEVRLGEALLRLGGEVRLGEALLRLGRKESSETRPWVRLGELTFAYVKGVEQK